MNRRRMKEFSSYSTRHIFKEYIYVISLTKGNKIVGIQTINKSLIIDKLNLSETGS